MKYILNNKFNFFSLSFLICLLLYFPTFEGGPVWDDNTYFFQDEAIISRSFETIVGILKTFNWPTSVLSQKALYFIFGENYLAHRLINFFLHFANSLLFFQFLRFNNVKNYHWAYLVFLLHPAMIISVAWIIQYKTLLAGFFALLSLNLLSLSSEYLGKRKKQLMGLSIFSYLLSISSKSASLPLVLSAWLLSKRIRINKVAIAVLVVTITFSLRKLITSPLTQIGIERAVSVTNIKSTFEFILTAIPQTLNWYFWQSLIPMESVAIRGGLPKLYAETIVGLFTMTIFFIIIRKNKKAMKFFLASFFMVLPFLGIIPAPYMTSAWVSEQHLYLVLMFFIPGLAYVIDSIPNKVGKITVQIISLLFVGFISFSSVGNYKNEYQFFRSSFNYNSNLPAGFQLLKLYIDNGMMEEARSHYYYIITTIPLEERPMSNMFWAQILQFEPQIMKVSE